MLLSFDDFLLRFSEVSQNNEAHIAESEKLKCELETILKSPKIGCDCVVEVYGSVRSKFCSPNSDIDLCILMPQSKKAEHYTILKKLANCLNKTPFGGGLSRIERVFRATIPLVKATTPEGFKVDISVGLGGNTGKGVLLAYLRDNSPSFKALYPLVKAFLKANFLNSGYGGTLNSYCISMLVIFFLQEKRLLPALCHLFREANPPRVGSRVLDSKCDWTDDEVLSLVDPYCLHPYKHMAWNIGDLFCDFLEALKGYVKHGQTIGEPPVAAKEALCPLFGQRLPLVRGVYDGALLVVEDPFMSALRFGKNASSSAYRPDNCARTFGKVSDDVFKNGLTTLNLLYNRVNYAHRIVKYTIRSRYPPNNLVSAYPALLDGSVKLIFDTKRQLWLAILLFGPMVAAHCAQLLLAEGFNSPPNSPEEVLFHKKVEMFVTNLQGHIETVMGASEPPPQQLNAAQPGVANTMTQHRLRALGYLHSLATRTSWYFCLSMANPGVPDIHLREVALTPLRPIRTFWFDPETNRYNVEPDIQMFFAFPFPASILDAAASILSDLNHSNKPVGQGQKKGVPSFRVFDSLWTILFPGSNPAPQQKISCTPFTTESKDADGVRANTAAAQPNLKGELGVKTMSSYGSASSGVRTPTASASSSSSSPSITTAAKKCLGNRQETSLGGAPNVHLMEGRNPKAGSRDLPRQRSAYDNNAARNAPASTKIGNSNSNAPVSTKIGNSNSNASASTKSRNSNSNASASVNEETANMSQRSTISESSYYRDDDYHHDSDDYHHHGNDYCPHNDDYYEPSYYPSSTSNPHWRGDGSSSSSIGGGLWSIFKTSVIIAAGAYCYNELSKRQLGPSSRNLVPGTRSSGSSGLLNLLQKVSGKKAT